MVDKKKEVEPYLTYYDALSVSFDNHIGHDFLDDVEAI